MNETTYTGEKTRSATLRMELVGDDVTTTGHGKPDDLADILIHGAIKLYDNCPEARKRMRKQMRRFLRDTRPTWIDRLMFDICGVAILGGGIYGFAWFMHWLEVTFL